MSENRECPASQRIRAARRGGEHDDESWNERNPSSHDDRMSRHPDHAPCKLWQDAAVPQSTLMSETSNTSIPAGKPG